MRIINLILFFLIFISKANAQYTLQGTTKTIAGSECYQLTTRQMHESGAVWYDKQLDLHSSFSLEFSLNFDNNPAGADGIVFVMQTVGPTALGITGAGIGFQGFSPSLGIEFDTYRNSDIGDPNYDHTAILRDGSTNHFTNTNLVGPVPIQEGILSVKDGTDYRIRIDWNAPKQQLTLFVNCNQRLQLKINAVEDVFKGKSDVWWGFTSATGLYYSRQVACLKKDIVRQDTIQICKGDSVTLLTSESPDNQYNWSPASLLTNPSSRTPTALLAKSQLFIAKTRDFCGNIIQDSVFVLIKPRLALAMGPDQQACLIQNLTISPQVSPKTQAITYLWSTGATTPSLAVNKAGTYTLDVTINGCTSQGQIQITQLPLPKIDTTQTKLFCLGQQTNEVLLTIHALESDLTYYWQHANATTQTITVHQTGDYQVLITNPVGCTVLENLTVLYSCSPDLFAPDAFTPNNDGVNDTFRVQGEAISSYELIIYNRWGSPIFRTTALDTSWDGRYENEPCSSGIYAYTISYQNKFQAQRNKKVGQVLLIR